MDYKSKYIKYKKKYLFIKNSNRKKIMFNPDGEQIGGIISKEEKTKIIKLYNQLSSGDLSINYDELSDEILEIIKKSVHEDIELLEYPKEKKEKMYEDIELIYSSIPPTEINYIGKVNIVALQCVIVFTENCCDTSKPFKENLNDVYTFYNELKSVNWKNYDLIKSKIINNFIFENLYLTDKNGGCWPTNFIGQIGD